MKAPTSTRGFSYTQGVLLFAGLQTSLALILSKTCFVVDMYDPRTTNVGASRFQDNERKKEKEKIMQGLPSIDPAAHKLEGKISGN